jgi:hypothetical protein
MCGATDQQKQLETEQAAFYQQATQEASTTFSQQQALHAQIKSIYDPILAAGPSQEGFSEAEKQNLEAQTVEGTAENYKSASKALGEKIGAQGGGDIPGLTGSQAQLEEELAASSAGSKSQQENQIVQADYAQGRSNFAGATAAEFGVSGELNPTAYNNSATGAGDAASKTANDIAQAQNSWINAALGAAGAIGGAVIGENPKGIFG